MTKRIRAVQGGTSASKTISILLYLIGMAQTDETPTTTSIVAESIPHLKRGAIKDFMTIMKEHRYFRDSQWNSTDKMYEFETGSVIEFFSVDQADKVRGARRDRLFANEANNISLDAFEQLEVRTKEFCFLDWNPSNEFWFYTDILPNRSDVEHIILTYRDNEGLSPEIVASIEQRKNRKDWWKVYGEGQLGEVEGKIFRDWLIIDDIPHEAKLIRRGIDFGYTNDPTVIVDLYRYNGGYIVDELCYQTGMSNKEIADLIKSQHEKVLVVADSAEPKSIDEIKKYGITIIGCSKGKDSVRQGIQYVQDQRISITSRSVNVIKDYRNYLWKVDKDGKILNVPEHQYKHGPDAIVYAFDGMRGDIITDLKKITAYRSNSIKNLTGF